MNEYDQAMSDCLDELRSLLDAGISDNPEAHVSDNVCTACRFITVTNRLKDLAQGRDDTVKIYRDGRLLSKREEVFSLHAPRIAAEKEAEVQIKTK